MTSIFYDLETTDVNNNGQILNYSFIEVNEKYEVVSELNGLVKLSRLQLPAPGAILVNRTDIEEHQKKAKDDEPTAMKKIHDYITGIAEASREPVAMVGFNSNRFDLTFLRTSFIRNGLYPYISNTINKDVLNVAKYIGIKDQYFRQQLTEITKGLNVDYSISFKLQCVTKALGIDVYQTHESRDDVLLTIAVAKEFNDRFGVDVRTFDTWELKSIASFDQKYPDLIPRHLIDSEDPSKVITNFYVKLDENKNYILLIDLDKLNSLPDDVSFNEAKQKAVYWFNKSTGCFISPKAHITIPDEAAEYARDALEVFERVNLKNFFPLKNCDIEQHVYMMVFDEMKALVEAIRTKDLTKIKEQKYKHAANLYVRHLMRKEPRCEKDWKQLNKRLKTYAIQRYAGYLKVAKTPPGEKGPWHVEIAGGMIAVQRNDEYHPLFTEYMDKIREVLDNNNAPQDDKELMMKLLQFYMTSDIYRVAGKELERYYYDDNLSKDPTDQ